MKEYHHTSDPYRRLLQWSLATIKEIVHLLSHLHTTMSIESDSPKDRLIYRYHLNKHQGRAKALKAKVKDQ